MRMRPLGSRLGKDSAIIILIIMTFCNLSKLDCTFVTSNRPIVLRYRRSHCIAHHIGTENFRECRSPHRIDVSSFCAFLRCDAMRCGGADGREPEKSTNRTSRRSRPNMLADRRSNLVHIRFAYSPRAYAYAPLRLQARERFSHHNTDYHDLLQSEQA